MGTRQNDGESLLDIASRDYSVSKEEKAVGEDQNVNALLYMAAMKAAEEELQIEQKEEKKEPDADREAIKREILEELKAQGLKPVRRRFTTRQKWAIAMFALQVVAAMGSLVELGINFFSALAYSIGGSLFTIIGAILLITDKKEDE